MRLRSMAALTVTQADQTALNVLADVDQVQFGHLENSQKGQDHHTLVVRVFDQRTNPDAVHRIPIQPFRRALVLGGGASGMTAALTIADAGISTITLVPAPGSLRQ